MIETDSLYKIEKCNLRTKNYLIIVSIKCNINTFNFEMLQFIKFIDMCSTRVK